MWTNKPAATKDRTARKSVRRSSITVVTALAIVGLIGTSASALSPAVSATSQNRLVLYNRPVEGLDLALNAAAISLTLGAVPYHYQPLHQSSGFFEGLDAVALSVTNYTSHAGAIAQSRQDAGVRAGGITPANAPLGGH